MSKKYELTNETLLYAGDTLYRIRALKDFSDVKAGDLGGYVQYEHNLSHEGDCWIYDYAAVRDSSKVYGDSKIMNESTVKDYAIVCGNSVVKDDALVKDSAYVCNYTVGSHEVVGGYRIATRDAIDDIMPARNDLSKVKQKLSEELKSLSDEYRNRYLDRTDETYNEIVSHLKAEASLGNKSASIPMVEKFSDHVELRQFSYYKANLTKLKELLDKSGLEWNVYVGDEWYNQTLEIRWD